LADKYDGIGSPVGLELALETIAITSAVQSKSQKGTEDQHAAELEHLEARFAGRWGERGTIAEGFGAAWAEVGDMTRARDWYQRAVAASDGGASIKAIEQLANMRARVAWEIVDGARKRRGASRKAHARAASRRKSGEEKARAATRASPKESEAELAKSIQTARHEIDEAIALLDKVVALRPTMERESLYGSTYKRLAMIESVAGDTHGDAQTALREMKRHYSRATVLGRETQLFDFSYPALNELAADIVLNAGTDGWKGLSADLLEATESCLKAKADTDPDFWSVLGQTELRVYQALARGKLASERAEIERAYADIQLRVSAVRKWDSVIDTASFVLPKYASRTSGSEKEAATGLLTYLEQLTKSTTPV
jgi:tetratricopeptide (TPR) repeat protein